MKAQVYVSISVEPQGVLLKGFKDDDIRAVITIESHEDKPLKLEPAELSLPDKVAYELKTIEKENKYQVVFKNISKKEGRYSGSLTLKTNYPQKPIITIVFIGYIREYLEFLPGRIDFGHKTGIRSKSENEMKFRDKRSIMVNLNRGDHLAIEKIEINRELFDTEVKEIQAGKRYRIVVSLHTEKLHKGILDEKMKVFTNYKDRPVKIIPIRLRKYPQAGLK